MLTAHVALVSEESKIKPTELAKVAGALSKQISRDFGPIWKINADVAAYEHLEDMPLDYWPIIIKDDIGDPSAAGYHEDKHGQPFSLVMYDRSWSLTASHECLEMLADPFGRRTVAGESPVKNQGRVNFLVEVCDPCEAANCAYTINGIQVSDFYTPNYFDPMPAAGVRYSYTGSLKEPRQVLKDGYLSWYVPSTKTWWQRNWFGGAKSADGPIEGLKLTGTNVRAAIDRCTEASRAKALDKGSPSAKQSMRALKGKPAKNDPFTSRADALREAIKAVSGS
ncbi:hypothetical protein QWJ07_05890 [Frankia sp. RB7]|nr:hypothetical protein [Frankia sp. RB7]